MSYNFTNIEDLMLGVLIGGAVVGASVYRTLAVHDGAVVKTFGSSIINGVAYFASMLFIVRGNITGYIGTMIGSTFVVCLMAYNNRNVEEKVLEPKTCGTCEKHCGNDWCVTKQDKR